MQPMKPRPKATEPPAQQSFDFKAQHLQQPGQTRSPGPSRMAFRLVRLWKKAWIRRLVQTALPLAVLLGLAVNVALDPAVHAYLAKQRADVMQSLSARPEFAIRGARVWGASDKLGQRILRLIAVPSGASTLTYDVAAAQAAVNALPPVRRARVTLAPDGLLDIHVDERQPKVVWRDEDDRIWLVDGEGITIGPAEARTAHPRLPLVLGHGADRSVAEAIELLALAPDLKPRVRAMVRIGARRWNIVLDKDVTILLPADTATQALGRVMAWHRGPNKVLDRGISHVDMRVPERPALRLTPRALELRPLNDTLRDGTGEET